MSVLVIVPVKSFGYGMARLDPALSPVARRRLGMALVTHTIECVIEAGLAPAVVTADIEVWDWAGEQEIARLEEPPPGGLDAAATAGVEAAGDDPWAVLHADLPLLQPYDLEAAVMAARVRGAALAPSADGGTSLVAGHEKATFHYGPGSFQRHLREWPSAAVVTRPGLALDLDTADDLAKAVSHRAGRWVWQVVS